MRRSLPARWLLFKDAHAPARGQCRLAALQRRHHRRQALGAADHERTHQRRLGAIDLVVQRRDRHRQRRAGGLCRRVQRWPQPYGHQAHEFDRGRKQQLAHVLVLRVLGKHFIDPSRIEHALQRQPRHQRHGAVVRKALHDSIHHRHRTPLLGLAARRKCQRPGMRAP
jgi:hypothetical protein